MKTSIKSGFLPKIAAAMVAGGLAFGAQADILIGSSLSTTGMASFLGEPEEETLRMLVEDINEAGGVLGEKLRVIIYDDAGDANKARTFGTRLIEDDEVIAIIGGSTTGATMAIMPIAEEEEIPFISLAGAIEVIDPVRKYTFKTPHTDRMACEKIFEDMQKQGITKIGLISGSDSFGASMRKQCLDIVGEYDIEVVGDETFGPNDADMTPQLTNLRGKAGVEAILNLGLGSGPAIVTRNYRQLGIEMPLYQSHGVASNAFIELAGADLAEGIRLPGSPLLVAEQLAEDDPQREVVQTYKERYESATDKPVSTFGGYAHDALYLFVDAIERAGSTDPVAIRDALEETEGFVGTTGVFNFAPDDHLGLDLTAFRMLEVRDGGWVIVED
ncbi:MAG TPA: ABC transporter substrate-binding protein [Paenalcaligenes sp.]|nr:ABC transporter substrate-binding protein [Paenalcaligenes sp.]